MEREVPIKNEILDKTKIDSVSGKNERNYGIDLLRIVSMFLVCLLHTLGQGNVLANTEKLSLKYELAWFLEIVAFCAVNCYGLVSGYVGVKHKVKYSNLVYILLQVLFYTILSTIIFSIINGAFSINQIVVAFLPVIFNTYWYFTCYFALFLFMPIFNYVVNNMDRFTLRNTLILIVFCVSIFNLYDGSVFEMDNGYSVIWLSVLYLVGGYISKYQPFNNIKNCKLIVFYIGLILFSFLSRLCIELLTKAIPGEFQYGGVFIQYYAPNMLLIGIVLLELFQRLKCDKIKGIIKIISPLTFGIYLIHENPNVKGEFIYAKFTSFVNFNPILMILAVIGTAIAIFIICAIIDFIRLKFFDLIKLKQKLNNLENRIWNKVNSKNRKI